MPSAGSVVPGQSPATARPWRVVVGIWGLAALGFVLTIVAFYPGWMSNDSVAQYIDARADVYHDWNPVLFAWWWRQLDRIHTGPAPFLVQNALFYWVAFATMAFALAPRGLLAAVLVLLAGFWPGTLLIVGTIWKDIAFGTSQLLAYALLLATDIAHGRPPWLLRIFLFLLLVFGVGVKTNGLTVLPVTVAYWAYVEGWIKTPRGRFLAVAVLMSVPFISWSIVPEGKVRRTPQVQYIQTHDLLAISASSGRLLLPDYVIEAKGLTAASAHDLYDPETNDAFFWGAGPVTLYTDDPQQLRDLQERWLTALRSHPVQYLTHRARVFVKLLRIGAREPGIVCACGIVKNEWGFEFSENAISRTLVASLAVSPWMFFPWIYLGMMIVSSSLLAAHRVRAEFRGFVLAAISGSWCFVLPHFFVAPTSEYRYLYLAYLLAISAFLVATADVFPGRFSQSRRSMSQEARESPGSENREETAVAVR